MRTFSIILIVAGILIFIAPEIVAYIIATVCLFIGIQGLIVTHMMQSKRRPDEPIQFAGYEIYRKKK